jgi:hypothetical protein
MLKHTEEPDRLARQAVLGIAAGRLAIGVGALLATGPALKALGFPSADTGGRALARIAGSRDIAIAAATFAARDDAVGLRNAALIATAVDFADAVTFGLAGREGAGRAAVQGVASGGAATAVGLWAWRRLGGGG